MGGGGGGTPGNLHWLGPCVELDEQFARRQKCNINSLKSARNETNSVSVFFSTQVQAELHKDPHVKPDQVSISRSGACLSLHTRPSTHDTPYHVHGPGSASPVPTPSIPTGKSSLKSCCS